MIFHTFLAQLTCEVISVLDKVIAQKFIWLDFFFFFFCSTSSKKYRAYRVGTPYYLSSHLCLDFWKMALYHRKWWEEKCRGITRHLKPWTLYLLHYLSDMFDMLLVTALLSASCYIVWVMTVAFLFPGSTVLYFSPPNLLNILYCRYLLFPTTCFAFRELAWILPWIYIRC